MGKVVDVFWVLASQIPRELTIHLASSGLSTQNNYKPVHRVNPLVHTMITMAVRVRVWFPALAELCGPPSSPALSLTLLWPLEAHPWPCPLGSRYLSISSLTFQNTVSIFPKQ